MGKTAHELSLARSVAIARSSLARAGLIEVASDERGAVQESQHTPDDDKVDAHTGEDWNVWCRETATALLTSPPAGRYLQKQRLDRLAGFSATAGMRNLGTRLQLLLVTNGSLVQVSSILALGVM